MFGRLSEIDERIEKMAYSAIDISRNHKKDFNTAVRDVADRHCLNNDEIERVCSRVNHIHFSDSFSNEKTATFKIAKYEEVISMGSSMKDSEVYSFDTKCQKEIDSSKGTDNFSKTASENDFYVNGDIMEHIFSLSKLAELESTGFDNAENLNVENSRQSVILSDMENHIIELIKTGETRESIEAMLLDVCGDSNADEIRLYLDKLFSEISSDNQNLEVKTAGYNGYRKDSRLCDLMCRYMDTMDKIAEYEIAHHAICHSLLYNGQEKRAMRLDGRVKRLYSVDRYLAKNASAIATKIERAMSKVADDATVVEQVVTPEQQSNAAAQPGLMDKYKGAIVPAMLMAGVPIAAGGIIHGVNSLVTSARKHKMKSALLKQFPELQNIDRQSYENIYDSLVGLEPTLLKAPYALAEMIKKHDQYGTIDSATTMNLISSGGKDRFGPAAFRSLAEKPVMAGTTTLLGSK